MYYTRVATSLALRAIGYPNEVRLSLLTRNRKTAYLRNIDQTKALFCLFEQSTYAVFKEALNKAINRLREQYHQDPDSTVALPKSVNTVTVTKVKAKTSKPAPSKEMFGHQQLDNFIESKKLEKVTNLTQKQLYQRCRDFLAFMKLQQVVTLTTSLAMNYRDELLRRNLSHKTMKDYLAAIKQFLNWCVAHEVLAQNPFSVVKLPSKTDKTRAKRKRWERVELKRLFSSTPYQRQGEQFNWITLIMLYQGCRPSEACQLRISDIQQGELPCIHFSNDAKGQHLKNAASNRVVPIHQQLINTGFLSFVESRKQQGKIQVFDVEFSFIRI